LTTEPALFIIIESEGDAPIIYTLPNESTEIELELSLSDPPILKTH